jgi:hypothetical protein
LHFKRGKKFLKNLSLRLPALQDCWMFLCVVDLADIIVFYLSTTICIKLLECLLNKSKTIRLQISSNNS